MEDGRRDVAEPLIRRRNPALAGVPQSTRLGNYLSPSKGERGQARGAPVAAGEARALYVAKILIPAAFSSILTGIKIGRAFAWRTLITAGLVFGVSSGSGGLEWLIYEIKNQLEIPSVFAGLFSVIIIVLVVENLVCCSIELKTVRKWGVQS